MLEEEGIVVEAVGTTARVVIEKKNACDTCAAVAICHPSAQDYVEVENPLGAVKGQRVKIVVEPQRYFKASVILYGVPVLAFIAMALMGKLAATALLGDTHSDLWAFVAACAAVGITYKLIINYHRRTSRNRAYHPVITKIMETGV